MNEKDRFHRAGRLLDAALGRKPEERGAFLDRECGGDAELRARVERMLAETDETTIASIDNGGARSGTAETERSAAPDLSGTSLGRFRVRRRVGRGGMGTVYEAHDDTLHRSVAIKVISPWSGGEDERKRFLREARAAARLGHPNIVAIHDAGEDAGRPFLVMEYVPGRSLDETPPASIAEAIGISLQICEALEHAHARGVVHRDLKPGNVLVTRQDDELTVKLTDMGIALTRGSARVTRTGAITGTPRYIAPEQALGQEVDGRADLYSLGVMLYRWVAGRPPFEGDDALAIVSQHIHAPVVPPRTYRGDIPAGLEPVILKLLSKRPEDRYASAAEVRQALEAVGTERAEASAEPAVTIEGLARGRMVGREDPLARLQALWRAAADGNGRLATISGEPGIGKTRLAHELIATARLDGALTLSGGCYENEATTPYLPFVEAFRRIVEDRSDDELRVLLADAAVDVARLAPALESRLGPFPDRPMLSSQEERLRLFDNVARFLCNLSGKGGLLFFLDDLHWADQGSLALLHFLLRQLRSERILFLGAYRDVELERSRALAAALVDWNRERLVTRVPLDRLSLPDTARMVSNLLGQADVSREFVASLHAETEGNPFFVEEIVKALIADGSLVREGSLWEWRRTGELVLPQSVKAAIGSRLDRVSDDCNEVLRTAAVLGKTFEFGELVSISGREEDALLDVLDEASAAQLVQAGAREAFAFTHDKIREVLYDELNPIRRRRLHARIAEGLERLRDQGKAVAVEDLAYHFGESGDYEKGMVYAEQAAAAARRVFAWDEALEMLTRARECAEALEHDDEIARIDEAMGDAANSKGDFTGAAEHYERALPRVRSGDRRNLVRCKIGEVYVVSGDPRGREHVARALEELDAGGQPRETAWAMMVEGRYLHLRGELRSAVDRYRPAIELAKPLGEPRLLVRLYAFLAGTYQHLADFEESDAVSRKCLEIGDRENVADGIMLGCEFLQENAYYRGRWSDCVRYGEREERLAREVHAGERLLWSRFRAFALHPMGRLTEAEELFHRGVADSMGTGERRLALFLKMGLAVCLADLGRMGEGLAMAEDAVRAADEADLLSHRIVGRGHLVQILRRLARFEEAAEHAGIAVRLWRESGSTGAGLINGAWLAEALLGGGDREGALQALDTHLEIAERTEAEHRIAQNLFVRGLLAASDEDDDGALALLERSVEKFDACGSVLDLARALGARSSLLRRRRRDEAADSDLTRARELLGECGATRGVLDGPD